MQILGQILTSFKMWNFLHHEVFALINIFKMLNGNLLYLDY